ncbi:glycosyltransferase family 4 protein [Actinobacillus pleuropneumoniae]|uniref:Cps10D n=1 Tax=Actinobacillus pleuropneumoniae serovar 10 TaxID=754347 RepID=F4YBF4_ACTPL|nr:glycosyltransferase family 4 protein [Actinobacillus pleuropneumoniae]AEB33790.1 Cps10D [Actinobacillus pleuropneumoniae serovar 10]EFM95755.1 hypothetical protein appser10_16430 [Actinobacillus pleuropneumoniae serovar 10 str. D13039]UKH33435.1 glycosyltransferase [Actinobacillus pleuropneumoniae serovar 10 str. D13039]
MILLYFNSNYTKQQYLKILSICQKHKVACLGNSEYIGDFSQFYYNDIKNIELEKISKILVIDNNIQRKILPNNLLVSLFSIRAFEIEWLSVDGTIEDREKNKPNTLFIFPGSIIPLSMGSHQRAFNFLYNLSMKGVIFDVLIPSNNKLDKVALKSALKSVASNVYFYRNKPKKFTKLNTLKRGIEKRVRTLINKDASLSDLFSERAYRKPTESLKRWVNSLYLAKDYENIIVSYAWLLDSIQYIEHLRDDFNLICDTHDVQFYRNQNILSRKERLFFNKDLEKQKEVNLLNKCDYVISISDMDKKLLEENINSKVIPIYPGFDYIKVPVKQRPVGRPIYFGFIGGSMSANVIALRYVIEHWWPVIKKHSPDSHLYIAGSICNDPSIRELCFFEKNIELLGFVKDIFSFYNKFEVSLNPVLVSGGLNFKSVEAVCAGKHLFTNTLGKDCLSTDFPCIIIDDPAQIIQHMNQIEFNFSDDKKRRIASQAKALEIFGNKNHQKSLAKLLG